MGDQLGRLLNSEFPNSINDNGVSIKSLLISTNGGGSGYAASWDFDVGGGDSGGGHAYFAGEGAADNSRKMVVLQGLPGGTNESGEELPQWKVLANRGGGGSGGFKSFIGNIILDAINSVHPAPAVTAGQSFEQWKEVNLLPAELSGPLQDADNDGVTNLEEFFFFTDPSDGSVLATPMTQSAANTDSLFTFRRAKDIAGVDMKITSSSNLSEWTEEVTITPENTAIIDQEDFEEVTISIPNEGESKYYRLELSEQN